VIGGAAAGVTQKSKRSARRSSADCYFRIIGIVIFDERLDGSRRARNAVSATNA
jgi:hypothetical protein